MLHSPPNSQQAAGLSFKPLQKQNWKCQTEDSQVITLHRAQTFPSTTSQIDRLTTNKGPHTHELINGFHIYIKNANRN